MPSLSFFRKAIKYMSFRGMFDTIDLVHKRSGKCRPWVFCDVVWCGLRYGAGYGDYRLCGFENLTGAQRRTYVTRGSNNKLVSLLNDPAYDSIFDDKTQFNAVFHDFVGDRGWLDLRRESREKAVEFLKSHPVIMAKPADGTGGKQVEKITVSDYAAPEEIYDKLKKNGQNLVEGYLIQHHELSRMYPLAVNTLRIVTVLTEGESHVIYAFIRIGNGGAAVDNLHSGGLCAPIDIDTGIITHVGYDRDENTFEVHPYTGTPIVGFHIPFWKESLELCLRAAHVVPQVGYVGWDVCVTENGPVLIEGNNYPGNDILQMPPHVPDKMGMLPRFKQYVKGL